MNPTLNLELRRNAAKRAHLYGAEALILEREADALMARAKDARRRYFRELTAIHNLAGISDSPFAALG